MGQLLNEYKYLSNLISIDNGRLDATANYHFNELYEEL